MSKKIDIPDPLITGIRNGEVILFLGAGASYGAQDASGKKAPLAAELAADLVQQFSLPKREDLSRVAELAETSAGPQKVRAFLKQRFDSLIPNKAQRDVTAFKWKMIATTNYDDLLEKAYASSSTALQDLVPMVKDRQSVEDAIKPFANPVQYLKLHGCINYLDDGDIPVVLTPRSYQKYSKNRTRLFSRLTDKAHEHHILFVGYGIEDTHILDIIDNIGVKKERPMAYLVAPGYHSVEKQNFAEKRITVIDSTFADFISTISELIPPIFRTIKVGSADVSPALKNHLRTNADPSEALQTTLGRSLIHICSDMPRGDVVERNFYRGRNYGYDAIAAELDFKRDVATDIVSNTLNYVATRRLNLQLVLGPAGRGKSTAIKRAAYDLSVKHNQLVFHACDRSALVPTLIEELHSMTSKPIILVVDDADSYLNEIRRLCDAAEASSIPISIISATRESLWNRSALEERPVPTDILTLKTMTREEFCRLLAKLEIANQLGDLASLSEEDRQRSFKNDPRELIAILHEITDGRPLAEILTDEYETLANATTKQLYLDICTLFQFRAPVRAGMIRRMSGIPFSMFKDQFFLPLEGVVLTQQNKFTGDFEYIARHPRIAEIVFREVLRSDEQRLRQLDRVLEFIDPGYVSDRKALDELTKAEGVQAILIDLKSQREFFNCLEKHLGEQWYLQQQMARLEIRSRGKGDLEKADEYAARAVEISDSKPSAVHTFAEVARYRSESTKNGDQKVMFRKQSKNRLSDIKQTNSPTVIYSRACMAISELIEAVKARNEEKSRDLVIRIRKLIQAGRNNNLSEVIQRKLEAKYQKAIGKTGSAALLLQTAVSARPNSEPLRLEASAAFKRVGQLETVRSLLSEGLEISPTSTAINFAFARFLMETSPSDDSIAFYLSRAYRPSDRNLDARLQRAGYLFSVGRYNNAAEIFDEVRNSFGGSTSRIVLPGNLARKTFKTRIENLYASYCLLELKGFPGKIYAYLDDFPEELRSVLTQGLNLDVTLRYTARGPNVVSAKLVREAETKET